MLARIKLHVCRFGDMKNHASNVPNKCREQDSNKKRSEKQYQSRPTKFSTTLPSSSFKIGFYYVSIAIAMIVFSMVIDQINTRHQVEFSTPKFGTRLKKLMINGPSDIDGNIETLSTLESNHQQSSVMISSPELATNKSTSLNNNSIGSLKAISLNHKPPSLLLGRQFRRKNYHIVHGEPTIMTTTTSSPITTYAPSTTLVPNDVDEDKSITEDRIEEPENQDNEEEVIHDLATERNLVSIVPVNNNFNHNDNTDNEIGKNLTEMNFNHRRSFLEGKILPSTTKTTSMSPYVEEEDIQSNEDASINKSSTENVFIKQTFETNLATKSIDDNKTNSQGGSDQSTSESSMIHQAAASNRYVVTYDQHPYPPPTFHRDNNNYIRQPILVDNLLALSNELPPLTAALPMQYLLEPSTQIHLTLVDHNQHHHISPGPIALSALAHDQIAATPQLLVTPAPPTQTFIENGIASTVSHHHIQPAEQFFDKITASYIPEIKLLDHVDHHHQNIGAPLPPYDEHLDQHVPQIVHDHLSLASAHPMDHIPGIPGQPWKDYPIYSSVPHTSFKCNGASGYFADIEAACQVWHYCQPDGRHDSFLCSNGTLFNQKTRVCDWWHNVDCKMATAYYDVNFDLYKLSTTSTNHISPPVGAGIHEPLTLDHHHHHHHSGQQIGDVFGSYHNLLK